MIASADVERRLLRKGLGPRWVGAPPKTFSRLVLDSRQARDADLFCAIAGARTDAHDLLPDVARAGAGAAVVERVVELEGAGLPQLLVRDTRAAASHLASLFHDDPGDALRLVGVTGTNGKTTTAWLLRYLLADLGPSAALGTLGLVEADGRLKSGKLTTPDPLELMETLAGFRDGGIRFVAMEVSSHALAQRRVAALHFDTAVFTTFDREHLDYHADMEEYRAAKLSLLELLEPEGLCVPNLDVPAWAALQEELRARSSGAAAAGGGLGGAARLPEGVRSRSYGFSADAEVRAESVVLTAGGSRWRLVTPEGAARVDLPLPGEWNVQNALAAAAVALEAGLVPGRIAERLSSVPPVPGRMEVLRREPCLVIRDYAHTPDAFARVLEMFHSLARGRVLVVFGCGGDRDAGKRPVMGRIASDLADLSIVTTDNPRSEDPEEIARQVTEPMAAARHELIPDRREAIARALSLARADDIVLLLGKGHETYQLVGDRRLPFDERAIVAELAAELEAAGEPTSPPGLANGSGASAAAPPPDATAEERE